ncbi:hypothetical protein BKA69DRAFT_78186 [Paraphysoderma sedebokerense]|nr:hypothetical protein BKA69DRAFT_78186 [Paraphysoderma sedebokerense]
MTDLHGSDFYCRDICLRRSGRDTVATPNLISMTTLRRSSRFQTKYSTAPTVDEPTNSEVSPKRSRRLVRYNERKPSLTRQTLSPTPSVCYLEKLPNEILESIFLYSQNTAFLLCCRRAFSLWSSTSLRAKFLYIVYGKSVLTYLDRIPYMTDGVCQILLEKYLVNPNIDRSFPLVFALSEKRIDLAKLLFSAGANVTIDCFRRAVSDGSLPLVELMLQKGFKRELRQFLYSAAMNGHPEVFMALLRVQNMTLSFNQELLFGVSGTKHVEMFLRLLELRDFRLNKGVFNQLFRNASIQIMHCLLQTYGDRLFSPDVKRKNNL